MFLSPGNYCSITVLNNATNKKTKICLSLEEKKFVVDFFPLTQTYKIIL